MVVRHCQLIDQGYFKYPLSHVNTSSEHKASLRDSCQHPLLSRPTSASLIKLAYDSALVSSDHINHQGFH